MGKKSNKKRNNSSKPVANTAAKTVSKAENNNSKTGGFMEGSGGTALCVISALCAAGCVCFAGINSYGIIKEEQAVDSITLAENGSYNSKEDVSAYILKYGHLPDNYITKAEAQADGWIGGSVSDVIPGKSIGGDRFYIEYTVGDAPLKAEGRYYTECDVNTLGKEDRGTERLIFSNDGLIYYTNDHYQTYELLYGQEVIGEFY